MANGGDNKRKYEDGHTSPPKRQASGALTLVRYIGNDFDQMAWQPVPPFIPSPLAKGRPPMDEAALLNLSQYDPIVRDAFHRFRGHGQSHAFREAVRGVCTDQHVAWADPGGPSILDPGEGLLLENDRGERKIVRFRRVTRTSKTGRHVVAWFLYVEEGMGLRINNQEADATSNLVVGPITSFCILEYSQRVVFLYVSDVGVDYLPLPGIQEDYTDGVSAGIPDDGERQDEWKRKRSDNPELYDVQLALKAKAVQKILKDLAKKREDERRRQANARRQAHEEELRNQAAEQERKLQEEIRSQSQNQDEYSRQQYELANQRGEADMRLALEIQAKEEEATRREQEERERQLDEEWERIKEEKETRSSREEVDRLAAEQLQRELDGRQRWSKEEEWQRGTEEEKTRTVMDAATAAVEKEKTRKFRVQQLPNDVEPCQYFENRFHEWITLATRSGIGLSRAIPLPGPSGAGEWLEDDQISRAIAAVTVAIELENGHSFTQITPTAAAGLRVRAVEPNESIFGHGRELLLPWNEGNAHWILVRVRDIPNDGPVIQYYDSLGGVRSDNWRQSVRNAIFNARWYGDGTVDQQPHIQRVEYQASSPQQNGWGCGYFTVLNAWCCALGLVPTTQVTTVFHRTTQLISMLNLAMVGYMDSATIHAFLVCTGFVRPNSPVAPSRRFSRTVPFLFEVDPSNYIAARIQMSLHPNLPRVGPEVIRSIVEHSNIFDPAEYASQIQLLTAFYQYMQVSDIPNDTAVGPQSPVSPATVMTALNAAVQEGILHVPTTGYYTQLKQVFDVYRALYKGNGILQYARQLRANEKAAGAPPTYEDVPDSPLYGNEVKTALKILHMLPPADGQVGTAEETGVPPQPSGRKPFILKKLHGPRK